MSKLVEKLRLVLAKGSHLLVFTAPAEKRPPPPRRHI